MSDQTTNHVVNIDSTSEQNKDTKNTETKEEEEEEDSALSKLPKAAFKFRDVDTMLKEAFNYPYRVE